MNPTVLATIITQITTNTSSVIIPLASLIAFFIGIKVVLRLIFRSTGDGIDHRADDFHRGDGVHVYNDWFKGAVVMPPALGIP